MSDEQFDEDAPLLDNGEDLPSSVFRFPEPAAGFRDQLLDRTASRVRARARGRRVLLGCVVAVAFLAGAGSGFWLRPTTGIAVTSVPKRIPPSAAQETPSAPSQAAEGPSLELLQDTEALARKLAALPRNDRIVFLRLAGDRYLNDLNDMTLALSCYRQMLSKLPAAEVAKPQPNDTWLLTMLKQARTDEVSHDQPHV